MATCSFHATKLFHTGEGGCVIAHSDEDAAQLRLLRSFGHIGDEHFQLGINAKFLGGDGICSGELPKLAAGAMADGQVICAEAGGVEGEQKAGMEKFKADFKKKFGAEVQIYAPYVYDATMVMVDAMVKAGSADPAKYLPVLAKENYKGVTGNISFDEKGDIKNGALTLYTYKGGKREQMAVVR